MSDETTDTIADVLRARYEAAVPVYLRTTYPYRSPEEWKVAGDVWRMLCDGQAAHWRKLSQPPAWSPLDREIL